ncbi:crystal protein ET79 [Thelonectria olida]|uniref:Crystal protein ET79 n=1 Tax=Thelonectria olida TaxID=1576542 RepID=A0A9P8VY45_9HYPO|nr:crystal protein ET79 [Thelonectria olida]
MSPSRSTKVTIINNLPFDLVLQSDNLDHGEWTQSLSPPQLIQAGTSASFQAESAGFATGDQGEVTYSSDAGNFTFRFDNPFSGSNEYSDSVPNGYAAIQNGGSGDNAEVSWTLQQVN